MARKKKVANTKAAVDAAQPDDVAHQRRQHHNKMVRFCRQQSETIPTASPVAAAAAAAALRRSRSSANFFYYSNAAAGFTIPVSPAANNLASKSTSTTIVLSSNNKSIDSFDDLESTSIPQANNYNQQQQHHKVNDAETPAVHGNSNVNFWIEDDDTLPSYDESLSNSCETTKNKQQSNGNNIKSLPRGFKVFDDSSDDNNLSTTADFVVDSNQPAAVSSTLRFGSFPLFESKDLNELAAESCHKDSTAGVKFNPQPSHLHARQMHHAATAAADAKFSKSVFCWRLWWMCCHSCYARAQEKEKKRPASPPSSSS